MSIEISTLPNGLRVVSDTMREAESAVLGVWVGVGTRHEPWRANGVAHLVEHMMFKGTKRRSAYKISAEMEKNGGSMNAYTTREQTAYHARVLPEDAELACDIVADMLQNSLFSPKELDRERQVIIQEIGRDRDTPEDHIFDLLHQQAFPDQRIGRSILGSAEVIAKLPRAAVAGYVKSHYHAGNMVLVGAGRIEHQELLRLARKYFARVPGGKISSSEKARIHSGDGRREKEIEQLHLILAFPGPGFRAAANYPAQLLSVLLGGAASSRLFQKVREQRGLVYSVSASHMAFSEAGLFGIYAGTDPARVKELIPVVCEELRAVQKRVTPLELRRAKAQLRADLLMGQESVMRRAEMLGHQMIAYRRPISAAEIARKLMAVTEQDCQAIAQQMFNRRPILAALGPIGNVEPYATLAGRLS